MREHLVTFTEKKQVIPEKEQNRNMDLLETKTPETGLVLHQISTDGSHQWSVSQLISACFGDPDVKSQKPLCPCKVETFGSWSKQHRLLWSLQPTE